MATDVLDHPNQVNNVLGFPLHFPWCPGRAGHWYQRSHEILLPFARCRHWPKSPYPIASFSLMVVPLNLDASALFPTLDYRLITTVAVRLLPSGDGLWCSQEAHNRLGCLQP